MTDDYLERMIARWIDLGGQIKVLENQRQTLADIILAEPDMVAGARRSGITVIRQRRFSATKAKEILTPEDFDAICEMVPNVKRAEQLLDPEVLDALRIPSGKKFLRVVTE